ncbi:hypothetical protein BDR05DRAFT_526342 [Suillus weaverae]|nr:hypothetical protein BDR05DRAFT_526342 [Suillus weaverae]
MLNLIRARIQKEILATATLIMSINRDHRRQRRQAARSDPQYREHQNQLHRTINLAVHCNDNYTGEQCAVTADLRTDSFAHGQLYTALSRVRGHGRRDIRALFREGEQETTADSQRIIQTSVIIIEGERYRHLL